MAPVVQRELFFLAVSADEKQSILETGYKARGRKIRASMTPHKALLAYERKHRGVAACLSFEPPPGAEWTQVPHGVYVQRSFLPPESLQQVDVEEDTKDFEGSDVFWAVAKDQVNEIRFSGLVPRHGRSIPVALSATEAQTKYSKRHRTDAPCILRIKLELARAAGFYVFEHGRGFSMHMPSSATRIAPDLFVLASESVPTAAEVNDRNSLQDCQLSAAMNQGVQSSAGVTDIALQAPARTGSTDEATAVVLKQTESPCGESEIVRKNRAGHLRSDAERTGRPEQFCADKPVQEFHDASVWEISEVEQHEDAGIQSLHAAASGGDLPFGGFAPEVFGAEADDRNSLTMSDRQPSAELHQGVQPIAGTTEIALQLAAHSGPTDEAAATVQEQPEFPHMKQGRTMTVHLRAGAGSDEARWVQGRIVQGGSRRKDVRLQVRTGKLALPEQIYLDDPRVQEFYHPDGCLTTEVEQLQDAQVQALHAALSGGELASGVNLQAALERLPPAESVKVGSTALQKCFLVPDSKVPQNGKAEFFKRLEASLRRQDRHMQSAHARKTFQPVRCFAVFECQADPPCPPGDGHFVVESTTGDTSDPRIGNYHLWDERNRKDVFKKYGSEMYLYMSHGQDLKLNGLQFDMCDYSHGRAPVLKAREGNLYLFYEWYKCSQDPHGLGQGRWILGPEVAYCPQKTCLQMSNYYAMTDITRVTAWPPWPTENMRMNLNSRDKLDDCFARSLDFQPYVEVQHGTYFWAFGRTPNGQEHIDTLPDLLWDSYGYGGSSVPREGWHGVRIVSPQGRRFHSSVVMAMQCGDNTFRCCEDASAVPRKGCLGSYNECHTLSEAIFIEQFDPLNPEHQLSGEHKCQECPDCFRRGDRCSKMKKQHVQTCPELWMQGRTFQKTEGGLETTVVFENVEVRVLCYPEMFVLNKSVWELGQQAPSGAKGSRQWFDTAFRLSNDKFSRDRPTNLADVLLLLNYATKPKPTRLLKTQRSAKRNAPSADEDPWRAAVNASSSVDVFDVMMRAVTSDREQLRDHMRQKAIIGEILKVEYGFSPSFKTGNPEGWITFPVRAAEAWEGRLVDECYHGTSMTNLAPILLEGLRKPQSRSEEAHGQWGSKSKQSIYASPSWYYAAHPVYSPLHVCKAGQAFQLVWKCIVRRGSYRSQRGTLGSKHWSKDLRMDPDHDTMDNMEYLIEEEGNICIKEVMFREFGSAADSRIYGELPSQLEVEAFTDADKLNAGWTEMLQKDFKKRGLFLRRPAVL